MFGDPVAADLCSLNTAWPQIVLRWPATNDSDWIKISLGLISITGGNEHDSNTHDLIKNLVLGLGPSSSTQNSKTIYCIVMQAGKKRKLVFSHNTSAEMWTHSHGTLK